MTAHETTPSDAAIALAFRDFASREGLTFEQANLLRWIIDRAREIEQGRGADDGDRLARKNEILRMESHHYKEACNRLCALLASITMRCAPPDTALEDGRTMRFVPPDPEFYWRELSGKVYAAKAEAEAIWKAQDNNRSLPPHGESR